MSAPERDSSPLQTSTPDGAPADGVDVAPAASRPAGAAAPARRAGTVAGSAAPATPAPRWRDIVLPVLYPQAHRPASWRLSALRAAFWLVLLGIFAVGVMLPLAAPQTMGAMYSKIMPEAAPEVAKPGTESPFPAGTRLRDCGDDTLCPWLRVLPPGGFMMGSAASERGRDDDEGPQHAVAFARSLAVMETEITRAQFAAFVNASRYEVKAGCHTWDGKQWTLDANRSWSSPGFEQTDQHPVVCVSWGDATAYAVWLSKETRQTYRLLSEAEWEFAARAGSTTRYSFGDREEDLCAHANVADRSAKAQFKDWKIADCSDGSVFTAPVRSYAANAFGLFDMHGNAWEWTADCWHAGYKGAPQDGSIWQDGCTEKEGRVLRGGGWVNFPVFARSAIRYRDAPDNRSDVIGFRLARTLTPSVLTPLQPAQQSAK